MSEIQDAARELAEAASVLANTPTLGALHAVEPAALKLWRSFVPGNGQGPTEQKHPHDLLGRLSAESVMIAAGSFSGPALNEVAHLINLRFCSIARGRPGYVRPEDEKLLSVLGMAAMRSFYSGLLCIHGGRSVECGPFVRQLSEVTAQFATIARTPGAERIWGERDDDPEGTPKKARVKYRLWEETFERKDGVIIRFDNVTTEHRGAIAYAWEAGSEMTHTRWPRVMGIHQEGENGDSELHLQDPPDLILHTFLWYLDVAYRCTEELGIAWRVRDPAFPRYKDRLRKKLKLVQLELTPVAKGLAEANRR